MPICFDLDGTLGHFQSGFVLLREALGDLWGAAPTGEDLGRCAGSTDWEIVDQLHRDRFGRALAEDHYAAYEARCVARFEAAFAPGVQTPQAFHGVLRGLHQLAERHPVWLVSGNAPGLLAFKARALGVAPHIPLLGSLPHHDRAALLRHARETGPGPHLYVGDRPHDLQAALSARMPFLAVGDAVPDPPAHVPTHAEAHHLVDAVLTQMASR